MINEEQLPEDATKQAFRKKVWDCLEKNDLADFPRPVHGRIPNFKGSPKAARNLSELDIFKYASTIMVTPDTPQETVRFLALEARKKLLVPIPGLRSGLFVHVEPPSNASKQELKIAASGRGSEQWCKPVGLDAKINVDLIVLGSVATSKEGYRIGKGKGYADLEFAMLVKMGAVNPNTVVAATVHDCQVFETLPAQLFKSNDVPVDFIITPTQVTEINPRRPKPRVIMWSLLSERQLNCMPILQTLRKAELGEGKDCTLKEGDFNSEERRWANECEDRRKSYRRNGAHRSVRTEGGTESPKRSVSKEEDNQHERPTHMFHRHSNYFRKLTPSISNSVHNEEVNKTENACGHVTKKERGQPFHHPRQRPAFEFSVRVSNIDSNVRVRDLKAALSKRGIKPTDITWRGRIGFAFLHFAKTGGSRNSVSSTPIAVDSIMASLQDLRVGGEEGGGNLLNIEPAKPITRIEVTGISSV